MSPLPDAPPKSPRVYKNLKTKTLEDVTFSDVEATGDPLSIEIHNEDELRRLVLVQLARLTTKSEWTGLLSSSGSSFPLLAPNGSSSAPSYSFSGDTNTGMYLTSGDTLSFSAAGSEKLRISPSGLQSIPDGTSTTPGISFVGDTQSGLFQPATNNVAIATDTNERIRVGDAGQIGIGGANYGTDGQVLTSKGASAAVEWADASGGGATLPKMVAKGFSATYQNILVTAMPPIGRAVTSSSTQNFSSTTQVLYIPYVTDGHDYTFGKVSVAVTGTGSGSTNFGIFTSDSDGMPDTLVTNSNVSLAQTSGTVSASFSSSISLANSTLFYLAIAVTDSVTVRAHNSSGGGFPNNAMQGMSNFNEPFIIGPTTGGAIPSSVTASTLTTAYGLFPMIMLELA